MWAQMDWIRSIVDIRENQTYIEVDWWKRDNNSCWQSFQSIIQEDSVRSITCPCLNNLTWCRIESESKSEEHPLYFLQLSDRPPHAICFLFTHHDICMQMVTWNVFQDYFWQIFLDRFLFLNSIHVGKAWDRFSTHQRRRCCHVKITSTQSSVLDKIRKKDKTRESLQKCHLSNRRTKVVILSYKKGFSIFMVDTPSISVKTRRRFEERKFQLVK